MKLEFYVGGFTPLGSRERVDKFFPFADDGTVKIEMPLWLTREVGVGVQGMAFSNIVIAPGQETSILMKVATDNRPFIAFKGYLAKTNLDLIDADNTLMPTTLSNHIVWTKKISSKSGSARRRKNAYNA